MHMISKKDLNDVGQRIGYILAYESPRKHASSLIARIALR